MSGADDQSEITLSDFRKSGKRGTLAPHTQMGEHLMTYEGLVLYLKEMDEDRYQRLCSVGFSHWSTMLLIFQNYMSSVSQLHQNEIKDLLMGYIGQLQPGTGDRNEACEQLAFVSPN